MYYVYIIKSESKNRYYVGFTNNIEERLHHHNSGATQSTRYGIPWILVYKDQHESKKDAWLRERQIKSYKGGNAFKKLIQGEVA